MGYRTGRFVRSWLAGAAAVGATAMSLSAAHAAGANATGVALATVVSPLAAVEIADLDFGTIATSAKMGGSVIVPAGSGVAAYTGGARSGCDTAGCANAHSARFVVTGEANRSYVVSTPDSITITGIFASGGAAPGLKVSAIGVSTESRPGSGPHGRLDDGGADRFGVGGVLEVPAGLGAARYRVSVPVVVTYS